MQFINKTLVLLFIFIVGTTHAQDTFINGYFIDNLDNKKECYLLIEDWSTNPTMVKYKMSKDSDIKTADRKTIKEFGIENQLRFVSKKVAVDKSMLDQDKANVGSIPEFEEMELFLKVLVEGKANLYEYTASNNTIYFYNVDSEKIELLIYKEYLDDKENLQKTEAFKQQLRNSLQCSKVTYNRVTNLNYNRNKLTNFFVYYNECEGFESINYDAFRKRLKFRLNIRPGLYSSSLSYRNTKPLVFFRGAEFDNELSFRFGIEGEFFFFQKEDRWSVLLEPTYQSFSSTTKFGDENIAIEYASIEVPIGVRYYFFMNDASKIFVNASYMFDFPMNSKIEYDSNRSDLLIEELGSNLAFGLGYNYKDRYSIEFRIHTDRDLLSDYVFWQSNYKTLGVILGYSIF